ncbi:hypothetical protein KKD70_03305 [Patescibacteria group bacterium]|nr:hypothetical protein [Patescibacteria group bacterium]
MWLRTNIKHFFDSLIGIENNLSNKENRLIFAASEKPTSSPETREKPKQKETEKIVEELIEYKHRMDSSKINFTTDKNSQIDTPNQIIDELTKKLGLNPKEKIYLTSDISQFVYTESDAAKLSNCAVEVSYEKGKFTLKNTATGSKVEADLNKEKSAYSKNIKESFYKQAGDIEKTRAERDQVIKENTAARESVSEGIAGYPQFTSIIKNRSILKKQASGEYLVDFSYPGKPGRINKALESKTQIQDIIDLDKLNNVRIEITITRAKDGKVIKAHYDMTNDKTKTIDGKRTFLDDTGERVTIFNGDKINLTKYEVTETNAPEDSEDKKLNKDLEDLKNMADSIETPEAIKARKEEREKAIHQSDTYLWDAYDEVLFKNGYLPVATALQDNIDKNWDKVPDALVNILGSEPFNLSSADARDYLKKVIQGTGGKFGGQDSWTDLNSRVYAEDFLKYKVNGKKLYPGGYAEMIKKHQEYQKKDEPTAAETAEYEKIDSIINGIARILNQIDANQFELQVGEKESGADPYRPMLSGIPQIQEKEKKFNGYTTYNISDLVHAKEKISTSGLKIKISKQMLNEIRTLSDGGDAKTLFMAHSFRGLVKQNCFQKIDENTYVLTSLPKTGWDIVKDAKKKDASEELKTWEDIREKLDKSRQARRFISKIFDPTKEAMANDIKEFKVWLLFGSLNLHLKGDEREITMENLGDKTTIKDEFEKTLSHKRGYLDMMKRTSNRVKNTTIYEPNPEKVKTEVNKYLEFGLSKAFMEMPKGKIRTNIDKMAADFGISFNTGELTRPLSENRMENMLMFFDKVKLSNIDPSRINGTYARYIRLGYAIDRKICIANNYENSLDQYLSTNPNISAIQKLALKKGCPINKLKDIEKTWIDKIEGGIGLGFDTTTGKWMGGVGGALPIAEWGKGKNQKLYLGLGIGVAGGKLGIGSGILYQNKLNKNFVLRAWVSPTTGGVAAGGEIAYQRPVQWTGNNYEQEVGVGSTVFLTPNPANLSFNVHVSAGQKWNEEKDKIQVKEKADALRKIDKIESSLKNGGTDEAAKAILEHPTFGQYARYISSKHKLSNEAIVQIYTMARDEWRNAAEENRQIPFFKNFKLMGYVGKTPGLNPIPFGVGALITFRIPGTEKTYVIRKVHPKFNYKNQSTLMDEAIAKELAKNNINNYTFAKMEMSGESGSLYFSPEHGRANISATETIGQKTDEKEAVIGIKSTFQALQRTFTNVGLHSELVPVNPKNPKEGNLIALTPLQTEDTTLKMLMDPALKNKGLIIDKENNRILLSASAAKKLFITRETYNFPFKKRGAMNLSIITFKANHDRSSAEIEEDSPSYISKRPGEKYTIVKGEMRSHGYDTNVITLKEFNDRQNPTAVIATDINGKTSTIELTKEQQQLAKEMKFETFKNLTFEFDLKEAQELTNRMKSAVGINSAPEIKHHKEIGEFAESWFKKSVNKNNFLKHISTSNPITEDGEKAKMMKEWQRANPEFSEQELNLLYSIMLHKAFEELDKYRDGKSNSKEAIRSARTLDIALKRRNRLFRNYLTKHIDKFLSRLRRSDSYKNEVDKLYPKEKISRIISFIIRNTMPQTIESYRKWSAPENGSGFLMPEGTKYATWTLKNIGGQQKEYMPSTYAIKNPENFENVLRLVNPMKLKITQQGNGEENLESEAAKLILSMLSPIEVAGGNLETREKSFLYSELALSVISIDSKAGKASPMVEVLGRKVYEDLIKIYETGKTGKPGELEKIIQEKAESYKIFKDIVKGIRKAQLAGEKTYSHKEKDKEFIFTINTEVYSGAYRKCANGTVASRQTISVKLDKKYTAEAGWVSASNEKGVSVDSESGKTDSNMTVAVGVKGQGEISRDHRRKKNDVPDRNTEKPKNEPGENSTSPKTDTGESGNSTF